MQVRGHGVVVRPAEEELPAEPPADPLQRAYDDPLLSSPGLTRLCSGLKISVEIAGFGLLTQLFHLELAMPLLAQNPGGQGVQMLLVILSVAALVIALVVLAIFCPLLSLLDSIGHHRGRHRHLRPAGDDVPQGQPGR